MCLFWSLLIRRYIQQGINWVVRKAIHLSEISLKVHQFEEKHETKSRTRVTISQRTSSGLPGTTEDRVLDWSENIQVDHVFGKSVGQARWIRGSRSADGKTYPNIDLQLQTDAEAVKKFLRGEILDDESVATGFLVEEPKNDNSSIESEGEGLWVHLFIQSHNGGWKAEQVCPKTQHTFRY